MPSEFYAEISTPEKKFLHGNVEMLIVDGIDGEMGIMKGHIPMITPLSIGSIKIKQKGAWREAATSEGFMEIKKDGVMILTQSVEWPEEIDINRALAAKERAEEQLRQKYSMQEYMQSKASLARALVRLRVVNRGQNLND